LYSTSIGFLALGEGKDVSGSENKSALAAIVRNEGVRFYVTRSRQKATGSVWISSPFIRRQRWILTSDHPVNLLAVIVILRRALVDLRASYALIPPIAANQSDQVENGFTR
jgi:hypothetical protein